MPLSILVAGATGKQGGAVVRALQNSGRSDLQIRALTRRPDSAAAKALSDRGVELVKGDLLDRQSLLPALAGVEAAYLVTDLAEREVEQGTNFVESAKESGVKRIVFSSVAGAVEAKDVEHFRTKFVIEEAIRKSGLEWTMLRPTAFLENTPPPGIGRFFYLGAMAAIFGNDKVYYIACEDIGKAGARALLDPTKYQGKAVELVGDICDTNEYHAALDSAEGYQSWRMWLPRSLVLAIMPGQFNHMFKWLSEAYRKNEMPGTIEETREMVPDVLNIESWARKQKSMREAEATKRQLEWLATVQSTISKQEAAIDDDADDTVSGVSTSVIPWMKT